MMLYCLFLRFQSREGSTQYVWTQDSGACWHLIRLYAGRDLFELGILTPAATIKNPPTSHRLTADGCSQRTGRRQSVGGPRSPTVPKPDDRLSRPCSM